MERGHRVRKPPTPKPADPVRAGAQLDRQRRAGDAVAARGRAAHTRAIKAAHRAGRTY